MATAQQAGSLPTVTVVGGSDPSAGAGIQADLRSLEMLGVSATTVVTALTVQDGRRLDLVEAVDPDLVERQLAAMLSAFAPRVVKCGLLPTTEIVACVARLVREHEGSLVVDPVLQSSAGPSLVEALVPAALAKELFPSATVVTFNVGEAEHFTNGQVVSLADMEAAARALAGGAGRAVVIKGGHLAARQNAASVTDVLWDGRCIHRFPAERRRDGDLHGSGCAFASATAAGLACGMTIAEAVARAGEHVRGLIDRAVALGDGVLLRMPPS